MNDDESLLNTFARVKLDRLLLDGRWETTVLQRESKLACRRPTRRRRLRDGGGRTSAPSKADYSSW